MKVLKTDYRVRLLDVLKQQVAGMIQDENCRPCPSCRVLIHKFEGCSNFICSCGFKFNFITATWPSIVDLEGEIVAVKAGSVVKAAEEAAQVPAIPPQFREQLEQLADMGFVDFSVLVPLLERHGGRLDRVVGALL